MNLFDWGLDSKGTACTRACVDDLGFALDCLARLKKVHDTLSIAARVAGLIVKVPKCCLAPLRAWSPQVVEIIRDWIATHIPAWKDIPIRAKAKYLGTFIGTVIADALWASPWKKLVERAALIAC